MVMTMAPIHIHTQRITAIVACQINTNVRRKTRAESLTLRGYSFPMRYFVYLKRSLTRAWRSHLLLVLLLTCAISLPMGVSILRASYQRGDTLQAEFVSGGHHIGIYNAQPGDEGC